MHQLKQQIKNKKDESNRRKSKSKRDRPDHGGSEWESTLYDLRSWELTEGQINEIMNGGSVKVSTERRSLLITKKEELPQ